MGVRLRSTAIGDSIDSQYPELDPKTSATAPITQTGNAPFPINEFAECVL